MESRALIDALSSPEAYPDRPCQVSMRQTHISWLFFTERFVYKLKKPVDFGFLDFRTLASRKLFCDEEVRLNRRLAPEVYLGVVEVKAYEGRIRLGGPGTTIDYAVQMRRLPENRMLPTLLAEGRVTVDTMRRLARLVAEFHAQSETGADINEAGTVATILTNWQESFEQTRPYLGFPLPRQAYDKIRGRVLAFCRVGEELFGQRIAEGRIRNGHGDLRAEHICVTEPIAIFDCIEFNRRFRHGGLGGPIHLAMGMAFWILPRYRQRPGRGREVIAWLAFALLNGGMLMVSVGWMLGAAGLIPLLRRIAEAGSAVAFGVHAWQRVRPLVVLSMSCWRAKEAL